VRGVMKILLKERMETKRTRGGLIDDLMHAEMKRRAEEREGGLDGEDLPRGSGLMMMTC